MMPRREDVRHGGQLILEGFLRLETDRLSPASRSPVSSLVSSVRADGDWGYWGGWMEGKTEEWLSLDVWRW